MDHILVPMKLTQINQLRRIMADIATENNYMGGEAIKKQIVALNSMTDEEVRDLHAALSKLG